MLFLAEKRPAIGKRWQVETAEGSSALLLTPVPAETMEPQGNLTYPKPGFTVTDSQGFAPYFPGGPKPQAVPWRYSKRVQYSTDEIKMQFFFDCRRKFFSLVFLGTGPEGFRAAAPSLANLQFLAFDTDGGAGRDGAGDKHVGADDTVPADDGFAP